MLRPRLTHVHFATSEAAFLCFSSANSYTQVGLKLFCELFSKTIIHVELLKICSHRILYRSPIVT